MEWFYKIGHKLVLSRCRDGDEVVSIVSTVRLCRRPVSRAGR